MVLDFAKEAIENAATHSINFDELKAGKANIKVFGVGRAGANAVTWLFNKVLMEQLFMLLILMLYI